MISTIPSKKSSKNDAALFAELDRHRRHRGWHVLTFLIWVAVFAVFVGVVAAAAATGAVTVPGLTALVYPTPPQPARMVASVPFNLVDLASHATATGTSATLIIPETNLSSLVAADRLADFREAEVMADPAGLSFFGYLIHTPTGTPVALRFAFVPTVTSSGTVSCQATSLTIGYLPLPATALTGVTSLICQQFLGSLTPKGATLTALTAGAGSLAVTYRLP